MAPENQGTLAGVLILSHPTPRCAEREETFNLKPLTYRQKILWANTHLRTISRLIIHPTYRGLSLATNLLRHAITHSPTPYLEARSHLARAFPLFQNAGFTPHETSPTRPPYFWTQTQGNPACNSGPLPTSPRLQKT